MSRPRSPGDFTPQEPPVPLPGDTVGTLLRNPGFRWLMAYRISTMLCYQIVAVSVGWQVYELTRDPFSLALIGLAEVIPFFCVAPFAGYLVDTLPRRKLGMVACALLTLTALVLWALTRYWPIKESIWPIYAAIALGCCARAFLGPI